jgi:carbon starvation protein CstA
MVEGKAERYYAIGVGVILCVQFAIIVICLTALVFPPYELLRISCYSGFAVSCTLLLLKVVGLCRRVRWRVVLGSSVIIGFAAFICAWLSFEISAGA